jgi:hypothetical protein
MKYFYHLIICLLPVLSFGQLTLGGSDPQDISTILGGTGVTISNVQHNGTLDAIAYFSANTYNMPFQSGFLMTTGSKFCAVGPNDTAYASIKNNASGLNLADNALNIISYDASVITFDAVPSGSTQKINYIFGSEEFGYSGLTINDAFGIFISGPGINGTQNIARLPNQNTITISNLKANSQYLVNNGNGTQAPYNTSDHYLQYNQLSIPLTASINDLFPGSPYHIILVIADDRDAVFDSGVFIEEGSVTASIDENTLDNFVNIAYNSSNQQATIQVTDYPGNLTYSVLDLSGKTMTQSTIAESTTIDLSDYASGMYLIHVEGSTGQVTRKVIR